MIETYINIIKSQEPYIKEAIPYLVLVIVCVILIRAIYLAISKNINNSIIWDKFFHSNKKTTLFHELGILIFLVYIVVFLFLLISLMNYYESHNELKKYINILPVNRLVEYFQSSIKTGNLRLAELKVFGNIILFMPIGFFIPLLWNLKEELSVLFCGFLISVIVELSQFFLNLGADVDNLILNTLGTLLGYLLYIFCQKVFPNILKKFKVIKVV